MKHVPFVTDHFSHELVTGVTRPTRLCRFLPEFGWEPNVLSVDTRLLAGYLDKTCR